MITKLYSVFDSKVEAYMPPMFLRTHGEAIRSFDQAVAQEGTPFNKNSEDFTLFYLGDFDDQDGSLSALTTPIPLAKAHEVLARQKAA